MMSVDDDTATWSCQLIIVCSVGEVMIVLLLLTAAGGWREPAGRRDHSTAVVGEEVYLWAGDGRLDCLVYTTVLRRERSCPVWRCST